MCEERKLWGLWYERDGGLSGWYLGQSGVPLCSYEPRLIAAGAVGVRKTLPEDCAITYSVREIGADGYPVESPLTPVLVEEDYGFQVGGQRPRPRPRGIPSSPLSGEWDGDNSRQVVNQFLSLPHSKRVAICQNLELPMDSDSTDSAGQFVISIRYARENGLVRKLFDAIAQATLDRGAHLTK